MIFFKWPGNERDFNRFIRKFLQFVLLVSLKQRYAYFNTNINRPNVCNFFDDNGTKERQKSRAIV